MILMEILGLLKADEELKRLLKINKDDPKIYPFGTHKIQDCIVYKLVPLTSDGIEEQNRFSITVISKDMIKAMKILEAVKKVLLTVGDEPKTNNILEISLNGGGDPVENLETGTVHIKANFIIKNRMVK